MAGTISKFEGQCPTAIGTPKWWDVNVIPLHDEDGNIEQILVISHDPAVPNSNGISYDTKLWKTVVD